MGIKADKVQQKNNIINIIMYNGKVATIRQISLLIRTACGPGFGYATVNVMHLLLWVLWTSSVVSLLYRVSI